MKRTSLALLALFFSSVACQRSIADEGVGQLWHDRSGFFSLEAKIIGVGRNDDGPQIKLRKADGTIVEIPYALFSEADQKRAVAWFREQQTKPKSDGATKLPKVGDRVKIEWGGSWWKGVIEEVDGDRYRFDYDGWDSYPDEWRTADKLRWEDDTAVIPGSPADSKSKKPEAAATKKPEPAVAKKPEPAVAKKMGPAASKPEIAVPAKPPASVKIEIGTADVSQREGSTETNSPFPPGLSPTETLEYLKDQAERGNLQVFWDWLPDEFRDQISSPEQRQVLKVLDQVNARGLSPAHFLQELVVVLRKHPGFVLKNPVVHLLLEDQETVDAFAKIYDPATDLLDEFTQLISNIDDEIRGDDFDAALRRRATRIGEHVAILIAAAPREQVDAFWDRFVVTEQAGGGTLTLVYPTGQKKTFRLVRINGRWMPKPLAETLLEIPALQRAKAKEIQSLSKAALDGRVMGAGMAQGLKDGNYMSLADKFKLAAAATDQQEFDAAIQQVLVALQVGGFLGG